MGLSARRIGLNTRRIGKMSILSLVLSVGTVENEFWACFAILLSQENRSECQENRLEHQENRENVHSELTFEC